MFKKSVFIGVLLTSFSAQASEPARVSVTRFEQEVQHILDHCDGWNFTDQYQLRTELERELAGQGLKVLERKNIRQIYADEYELPNLEKQTKPKRGKFLAAQYTITGGITELGICDESSRSALQLGGLVSLLGGPAGVDLGVKRHQISSKVKLVAQIVSVETGEVLRTFTAGSEVSDSGYGLEASVVGIGVGHKARSSAPIEKASNDAVRDLAGQIARYLL